MTKPVHIIILEDNPVDAELVQYELQEAGFTFTSNVVMTEKDFVRELQEFSPDLILSDYDLPHFNGALALAEAKRICPDTPFILVTGAVGEDRAIEILTQGAKDYVLKSRLQRLAPAVRRALAEAEEHRARKSAEEELRESHRTLESMVKERGAALREADKLYRSLFENMLNGFAYCRMLFDQERPHDFMYLDVNSAFESLTGLKNVIGKKVSEVIPGIRASDPEIFEIYGRVSLTGRPEKFEKYIEALKMWFSISVFSPQKEHFVAVFDVITERKLLEETQSFLLQHSCPDEDFFASLARYLAQSLGMDYVCIDRLHGDRLTAQTVAIYFDGKFEDNVEYALKDIPCGDVVGKTICCFPQNVRHLFPRDTIVQEIGAESYVGTTLWSSKGQPIGLIAVLSRKPLANPRLAEAILKLAAVRAAGELERTQVEEDRYQSERHFSLLHETMLQGVVYQDAEGKILSMNPAAVRILGKSPEEFPGHTSESGEHPTFHGDGSFMPALEHPSMVALRTGQELRDVVMGVYNPREKDYRWLNVHAMPLFRPGEDKPYQVYIIFDDITERKRIETTLQDSEVRYRRLFEAAQDGILIVDAETGKIVDVNPFLMDMLGYSKEEFAGKKLWEIGAVKDIEKSKTAFAELQNERYIRYEDLQLEANSGRLIDVEFVSNIYLVDHTKVVQCNIRNITERRKAERRQSLTAEIMGIINESPALSDTINRILSAIKRETGCEAAGIRLRSGDDFPYAAQDGFSHDFLLTENTLAVRGQDGMVCRNESGNINLECTCGLVISGQTDPTNPLFTQGGSFWTNDSVPQLDLPANQVPRLHQRNRCSHEGFHSVALIPIRANREIVGLLQLNARKKDYFALDMITFFEGLGSSIGIALTRQRAEEAIKERTAQLEAANKELESFSYSISHDLRAPLRAIDGYTRMLLKTHEEKFDEDVKRKFQVIRNNVHKMEQLIDDILSFARVGRQALSLSVLDMEALVKEIWHEQLAMNPDRKMELANSSLPQAFGDRALIRQVLFNLLSNAVKFTKNKERALIEVGGKSDGGETIYSVKDNGAGFDMQYYEKLFGVFQRLHSESEFEGTGVGLAIVKQGINRHGGRVWGEGRENEGAIFYFTLPQNRHSLSS